MERAARKWRGGGEQTRFLDVIAGISPIPNLLAGMTGGGGGGIPGEGKTGGGFIGGGTVNTLNGNMMKPYALASWPSVGELDFAFNIYHNSVTDYNLELGANWSFSYGAKLEGGTDITIRWGDGNVVVFEQNQPGVYTAPPGCFDELTEITGGFIVTTPDQTQYEFTDPNNSISGELGDLVAIRDRNGNEITITISTINGKEVATRVEDAITSRYVDITYNSSTHQITEIEDHDGRVWEFLYTGDALDEIVYPEINDVYSREFEYNVDMMTNAHRIYREWDLRGEMWEYTYSSGKITSAKNPLSKTTTYAYDPVSDPPATTITHPGSMVELHYYDGGFLTSEVDEENFTTNYLTYNSDRLATEIQDRRGKTWYFEYDTSGNLEEVTDPNANTTTYAYEANNDLNTVTNAEGDVWNYNYYTAGAKNLKEVYDPQNRRLALYDYNAYGDIDSIKDADGEETTIAYETDGYPKSVTDPIGNISKVHFDVLGRVDWVEDPLQALTTGTTDDRVDYLYDDWDRLTKITHPKQDLMGLDPRYETHFDYNNNGDLVTLTDERGETITYTYNAAGQLTGVQNQEGETETYGRSDRGWVTQVTNGRGKIRYNTYTDRGELYHYKLSLGGISAEGEVYTRDGNGNTTIHGYYKWGFSPTGEYKYYDYDDANRLEEVDYDTGSMTNVIFGYDLADRMTEMVDGTGTTIWVYDDGDLIGMETPQGDIEYAYDSNARLYTLTEVIPGGTNIVTTYDYDDAGRTETIDKFGETTEFVYDGASRPEKMIYDTGAYAKYLYDGRNRIKAVEHYTSGNSLLRKETNTYDPASRITARYEGPASGGVTTTFTYDDVGQLTGESASGYSASYTYDANGNRTNRTVNGVSETYTVDDSDKLTSVTWSSGGNNYTKEYAYHYSGRVTGVTYKTNGVTTSSETLTWNKENRLTSRGIDTYTYNGLNTRVAKSDGGGSFTYKRAGAHQTAPVLADGAANYLPGISEKRSGTSTFLHSGIKNGQLQTNSSQSNTATNRYDAFGNVLATTGTWKGPFAYGGKFGYQTDDVDMQLLGDRYYDPTIGRFLSRDSARDGRNWYGYCNNNPLNHFDNTGKWWFVIPVVLLAWDIYESANEIAADPSNPRTYLFIAVGIVDPTPGNIGKRGLKAGLNVAEEVIETGSSRAARREVIRQQGIPTSQQPTKQYNTPGGRAYEYETPKPGGGSRKKTVTQHPSDPNHGPHWEGGVKKPEGVNDGLGRPRHYNEDPLTGQPKTRVGYEE
jgi:RHS repeat-associated protein